MFWSTFLQFDFPLFKRGSAKSSNLFNKVRVCNLNKMVRVGWTFGTNLCHGEIGTCWRKCDLVSACDVTTASLLIRSAVVVPTELKKKINTHWHISETFKFYSRKGINLRGLILLEIAGELQTTKIKYRCQYWVCRWRKARIWEPRAVHSTFINLSTNPERWHL